MKWKDLKNEITSLSAEEKSELELMAMLAMVRKQRKMKQAQLAEKANVTQAQIARVENLTYSPSLDTLTKILNGLELDLGFVDRNTGKLIRFVSK